ncbi:MAG: gamma-glutamyltransferase [Flavobacteriales bacterium]|nr:gamma-glutamyltransferase [Flavobacteriales bacterium]MDW8433103.1 gamma-glutamyltransferase [Flavobacteriales bacterium]
MPALRLIFLSFLVGVWAAACGTDGRRPLPTPDLLSSGTGFRQAAVVCAHPLAAKAGRLALLFGGNAVDAAVAVHFALAVVYPNAGNLGGGGFMMYRPAAGQVYCLDFREVAPQAAHRTLFLDNKGRPVPGLSTETALAAGVPGSVAGLAEAHRRFGRLPWYWLLKPAVHLAEKGFPVTARQAEELNENAPLFRERNPKCPPFVAPRPEGWQAGDTLRQPELARALLGLAQEGPSCFYTGWIADSLEAWMRAHGGLITRADLQAYRPVWRRPLHVLLDTLDLWAPPPPSAGGLSVLQMLRLQSLLRWPPQSLHHPEMVWRYCHAAHLAFEDRYLYAADPDHLPVPVELLLDSAYLLRRYRTLELHRFAPWPGRGSAAFHESTTHFSIADAEGGLLALTTTLNDSYGSRLCVCGAGFLLNNEMDDFSVAPGVKNLYGLPGSPRNAVAPGRRMVSSMAPILVERRGRPFLAVGTPGGTTIVSTLYLTLYWTLVLNQPLEAFHSQKRYHYQALPDVLFHEEGAWSDSLAGRLRTMGLVLRSRAPIGRMDGLQRRDGLWYAAPDPRGDDAAEGF